MLKNTSTLARGFKNSIYSRPPLYFHKPIQVFSTKSDFIENYENIAQDHINAITVTCKNPWIEEEDWRIMEASTM